MGSIYSFLVEQADSAGYLPTGFRELPDQQDLMLQWGEKWIPGAFEGTLLRSNYSLKQHLLINFYLSRIVRKQIRSSSPASRTRTCEKLIKYSAISIVDPLLSFLSSSRIDLKQMRREALWLVQNTEKRELVKIGIALLGQCGKEEDIPLLRLLGSMEEFTLFAAVAAKNILGNPEEANAFLMTLAERLEGWGKIAILYELDYELPDAREWVLRKGCGNTVGLSYLANVCATKGRLADKLDGLLENPDEFDEELYQNTCDIFQGLLEDHPENDGISQYRDAQRAAFAFLKLVRSTQRASDSRTAVILTKLESLFG